MPLKQFQDPSNVGASEYRAIYELLGDGLEDHEGDEDEMIVAMLDEVLDHALAMRHQVTGSPQIKTALFVDASDLFAGCSTVWDAFSNSDPDMSWGDNNRTLASREALETALGLCDDDQYRYEEYEKVMERLSKLPDSIYIDLEN